MDNFTVDISARSYNCYVHFNGLCSCAAFITLCRPLLPWDWTHYVRVCYPESHSDRPTGVWGAGTCCTSWYTLGTASWMACGRLSRRWHMSNAPPSSRCSGRRSRLRPGRWSSDPLGRSWARSAWCRWRGRTNRNGTSRRRWTLRYWWRNSRRAPRRRSHLFSRTAQWLSRSLETPRGSLRDSGSMKVTIRWCKADQILPDRWSEARRRKRGRSGGGRRYPTWRICRIELSP